VGPHPTSRKGGTSRFADASTVTRIPIEDVAMQAMREEVFQRTPQPARPQVSAVMRSEHHVGAAAVRGDLVGAPSHGDTIFDAQLLNENVEPDEARALGSRNALLQIP
jgi:hypothetical protein